MRSNALQNESPRSRPVQDEWGLFDPQQAGLQAVMRALGDAPEAPAADPATASPPAPVQSARLPAEPIGRGEQLSGRPESAPSTGKRQGGALYTLEAPAQCPECESEIRTLRVLRVLRTQVSFTSTLPRKGYVILCPECDRLLSAELSGLV